MAALLLLVGLLGTGAGPGPSPGRLADLGPAPSVELIGADGRPFRLAELRGRVVLVSFIYTTCNGVCPATTHNLYRVQEELKRVGLWDERVAFVSITLDPERDTPEVLARYAEIYGCDRDRWHFVTGSPAQVRQVLDAWDMWARRDVNGVLDHPSRIFLLDPRGRRREIYNLEFLTPATVREDVLELLADQ
jgi:protein SCO1/2